MTRGKIDKGTAERLGVKFQLVGVRCESCGLKGLRSKMTILLKPRPHCKACGGFQVPVEKCHMSSDDT